MSHKITFPTFRTTRWILRGVDERPPPVRIAGFRQPDRQEVTVTTRQPTALRQRMLDDMRLRNMAAGTCRSYVRSVADFSAFHGRSPDRLTLEDVRDYQLHLVARGLEAASICPIMSALRFLYAVTLDRKEDAARIPLPRKADPPAGHPLPRGGGASAGRGHRPVDAGAADHRLRRRPARLGSGRAPGDRHRQRTHDHPRARGQGRARPLRHALAPAARDPARPLAPHPLPPPAPPPPPAPGCSRDPPRPGRSRSAPSSAPAARRSRPPGSTSR